MKENFVVAINRSNNNTVVGHLKGGDDKESYIIKINGNLSIVKSETIKPVSPAAQIQLEKLKNEFDELNEKINNLKMVDLI